MPRIKNERKPRKEKFVSAFEQKAFISSAAHFCELYFGIEHHSILRLTRRTAKSTSGAGADITNLDWFVDYQGCVLETFPSSTTRLMFYRWLFSDNEGLKGADKFLKLGRTLVVRGLYPTAKYFARTGCWDETQHMMQDALKPVPVRVVPLAPAEPEEVPLEEMTDDFEGYEEIRTETDAGLESPDALVVAENAEDAAELACYDEEEREREAVLVKKDEEDPS